MADNNKNKNLVFNFIASRSNSPMERQQVIVYLVAMGLAFVGMTLHLVGALGSSNMLLSGLSVIYISVSVVTLFLWLINKIELVTAFSIYGFSAMAIQVAKVLFITFALPPSHNFLVIGNGIVSMSVIILLVMSYMKYTVLVTGLADIAVIIFAAVVLDDKVVWQYAGLNTLFMLFFIVMGGMMSDNVRQLQNENKTLHNDEQRLLQILRLNRKEIVAYSEMCRTSDIGDDDTDRLFGMLSEKSQRNVINAVERKKAIEASRNSKLEDVFPSFSPVEIEVTRLILRDFKLSQIQNTLGKSESNINAVRSHMRKKLGMTPGQDLRKELLKAVKGKLPPDVFL